MFSKSIDQGYLHVDDISEIKEKLQKAKVLPSVKKNWCCLDEHKLLVNDEPEIASAFATAIEDEDDGVLQFVLLPEGPHIDRVSVLQPLFDVLQIRCLSELTTTTCSASGRHYASVIGKTLQVLVPYIQRYLHTRHSDLYATLVGDGIKKRLSTMLVCVVDELAVKRKLFDLTVTSDLPCLWQPVDNTFYVDKTTSLEDKSSTFTEFTKIFFRGSTETSLANFMHVLSMMLDSGDEAATTRFLAKQKLDDVDTDELWCLHMPDEEGPHSLFQQVDVHTDNSVLNDEFERDMALKMENQKHMHRKDKETIAPLSNAGATPSWPPNAPVIAPMLHNAADHKHAHPGVVRQTDPESWAGQPGLEPSTEHIHGHISPDHGRVGDTHAIGRREGGHHENGPIKGDSSGRPGGDGSLNMPSAGLTPNQQAGAHVETSMQAPQPDFSKQVELTFVDIDLKSCGKDVKTHIGALCYSEATDSHRAIEIGRWGEELVHMLLTQDHGEGAVWVNKEHETGQPFDITIGSDDLHFVEVKTTATDNKMAFEISIQELMFAAQHQARFSIFRVFNAGADNNDLRVIRIENPVEMLARSALKLLLVM
jgi:hypothetical protein